MQLDHAKLVQVFVDQSVERLVSMEEALVALEARPEDGETLDTIFRVCHTLKGDADALGFANLTEFAHLLEELLDQLRSGANLPGAELITLMLECTDALRLMIGDVAEGAERERPEVEELVGRLRAGVDMERPREGASPLASPTGRARAERSRSGPPSLRVRVDTLDRLLNLTGELAVARSHMTQLLSRADVDPRRIAEAHFASEPLFSQLQEEVMKVRLVPVGPLLRQHNRTVRDLAISLGKRAKLRIEGEDAELDTNLIEHLRDPLSHIVRNAVAHGIESLEERKAAGKDRCGVVEIRAFRDAGTIVVEVSDDGRGLDREHIRERALEMGLIGPSESWSPAQLERLIFEPGFSTSETATLSSGRGVGMDVVRRDIEALHGSIGLESEPGRGTKVVLRLPLTLAIIEGFGVGIGDETYVLPLGAVVECIDLDPGARRGSGDRGLLERRGRALPYVRLRSILGRPGSPPDRESVVVIRSDGQEAGIAVDTLYGERQAVIKPLGPLFQETRGIGGSTILGDGRVALILEASELLRFAAASGAQPTNQPGEFTCSRI